MKSPAIILFFFAMCLKWLDAAQVPMPDGVLEIDCEVSRGLGGYDRLDIDLGSLKLDKKVFVKLHVRNPHSEPVRLGKYFSGCTCLKVATSSAVIEPNQVVDFEVELRTPVKVKASEQVARVQIGESESQAANGLQLTLHYNISGLVAFRDSVAVASAISGAKTLTFKVPLIVEKPANWKAIVISKSSALNDLSIEVREREGEAYLECQISTEKINSSGTTGEIFLTNPQTEMTDTLLCTLVVDSVITIAPKPIRLKWSEKEGRFLGTALVRFNAPIEKRGVSRLSLANDVVMSATYDGAALQLQSRMLTPGLFKVNIEITPNGSPEELAEAHNPDGLIWILTVLGKDYTDKVSVVFQK